MLLKLQRHLQKTRERQQAMEKTFRAEDRKLVDAPEGMPRMEWVVVVLCGVVISAGLLTAYAVWQL
jgi:hypothetical protein